MSISLDEALDRFADQTPEERERFVVDDDQKASWALRKLRGIKAHKAANQAIADEEIARINQWLADANSSLDRDEQYFTGMLTAYARICRERDDRKSVVLPYGKIGSRVGQPKWNVDNDVFMKWLEANHKELIRVKTEPNLAEAKKVLEIVGENAVDPATGEVAEGIQILKPDITYTVEVDL